jgi:hypothetical protein
MIDEVEPTFCYTYKVEMLVQVVSKDEPSAAEFLEKNGGYITSRKISLMDVVSLYNGKDLK